MGAAFLITLREGLEIAIVLAILVGYLVKTDRRAQLRSVWLGAGVAAVVCLIAGVAVHAVTDELTGKAEQAVEGTLALCAALVLTYMILWMHKNARSMGGHLRARVDGAQTAAALSVVAFIGVAREGFETVLFLLGAETGSSSGAQVVLGGLLGLALSALAGYLVYVGGSRIDLQKFFRYTGIVLILFAAGLVGKAFHEFRELLGFEDGWLVRPMWEITSGPLASGTLHDFLKGLFGWAADPERIRVLAYFAYAVPVLWLFLRVASPAAPASASSVSDGSAEREPGAVAAG
ncbi:MAG: FTR1 family protein [Ilumatobacteraceae bacterium]